MLLLFLLQVRNKLGNEDIITTDLDHGKALEIFQGQCTINNTGTGSVYKMMNGTQHLLFAYCRFIVFHYVAEIFVYIYIYILYIKHSIIIHSAAYYYDI